MSVPRQAPRCSGSLLRSCRAFLATCAVALFVSPVGSAEPVNDLGKSEDLGRWESASGKVGTTVYFADQLFIGSAGSVIQDAAMVVSDGKVAEVTTQAEVTIQPGWEVVSFPGATVVPGMVIAETGLVSGGDEERTLSPEIRSIDGFDFFADYDSLLARGITTVQVSPGRNRLIPGQTAVVKLGGDDPIKRTVAEVE